MSDLLLPSVCFPRFWDQHGRLRPQLFSPPKLCTQRACALAHDSSRSDSWVWQRQPCSRWRRAGCLGPRELEGLEDEGRAGAIVMPRFSFQGAVEDPQTALALNLDPALTKKSDTEGARMLFPESELSIRIGRAGLLSGKLPAADRGQSQTGETGTGAGGVAGTCQLLRPVFARRPPHCCPQLSRHLAAPPFHVGSPNHCLEHSM